MFWGGALLCGLVVVWVVTLVFYSGLSFWRPPPVTFANSSKIAVATKFAL